MSSSAKMPGNHLYSVYFAPRGSRRLFELGMQIAQMYLSPFDKLIGVIGDAGSGKSMIIKGMFPGLELTNDDEGVNVRPLPLLNIDDTGFYTPHTYHVDIRFEAAFTQLHALADAILEAVGKGKRVIVEHFEVIYPFLKKQNAHLLIGVGGEVIITRPNLFGPLPQDIADIVYRSIHYRKMAHTAENLLIANLDPKYKGTFLFGDVRHGFVLSFEEKPELDFDDLVRRMKEGIEAGLPVTYVDEKHIRIGDYLCACTGPRINVTCTNEIEDFKLIPQLFHDTFNDRWLLVGLVGYDAKLDRIDDLNKVDLDDEEE